MLKRVAAMTVCSVLIMSVWGFAAGASIAESKNVLFNPPKLTEQNRDVKEFDEYTLPISRLNHGEQGDIKHLEGRVTKVLYKAAMDVSTLQIYKYYEKILLENGFTILFKGNGDQLGNWDSVYYRDHYSLHGEKNSQRHITAQKDNVYVSFYTSLGWYPYAMTSVDMVETGSVNEMTTTAIKPERETPEMTLKQPTAVNTNSLLEQKFMKRGSVIVAGVKFNETTDEITDDSEPSVEAAAAIIRRRPGINFSVIYYTDSNGSPQYCKELSKRRADNFVQALIMHDVNKSQLSSVGAGWVPTENLPANSEKSYGNRLELSTKK